MTTNKWVNNFSYRSECRKPLTPNAFFHFFTRMSKTPEITIAKASFDRATICVTVHSNSDLRSWNFLVDKCHSINKPFQHHHHHSRLDVHFSMLGIASTGWTARPLSLNTHLLCRCPIAVDTIPQKVSLCPGRLRQNQTTIGGTMQSPEISIFPEAVGAK